MRERLSAMTQAAEVSAMQTALATTVRERMEKIDSMMGEPSALAVDDEVEEWKRKIEALSKPVTNGSSRAAASAEAPHVGGAGASLLNHRTAPPADERTRKQGGADTLPGRDEEVLSPGSQEIHRLVDDDAPRPVAEAFEGLEHRRAVWCCCT